MSVPVQKSTESTPAEFTSGLTGSIQRQPDVSPLSGKESAKPNHGAPVLFVESMTVSELIERGSLDLESEFWPSAAAYADRALALEPESGDAWLVKLMAEVRVSDPKSLCQVNHPLDFSPNYQKIVQLRQEPSFTIVQNAQNYICAHFDELYRTQLDQAQRIILHARNVPEVLPARDILSGIPDFPASRNLREKCDQEIQGLTNATRQQAEQLMAEYRWEQAIPLLESISDLSGSRIRLMDCREGLAKEQQYQEALKLQQDSRFREALQIYSDLGRYRDSAQRVLRCKKMIRGNKVRCVGRNHTVAVIVNTLTAAFMSTCCFTSAPGFIFFNLLWYIPLLALSIIFSILQGRFRHTRKIWAVLASVFTLFIALTIAGVVTVSPSASPLSSLFFLALSACLIFI